MPKPQKVIRVLTYEEIEKSKHYSDFARLSVIFNHDIVEERDPTDPRRTRWAWKENALTHYIEWHTPVIIGPWPPEPSTQVLTGELHRSIIQAEHRAGRFSTEELMKFYMQSGDSLAGFIETFGLSINSMLQKYAGKVLRL